MAKIMSALQTEDKIDDGYVGRLFKMYTPFNEVLHMFEYGYPKTCLASESGKLFTILSDESVCEISIQCHVRTNLGLAYFQMKDPNSKVNIKATDVILLHYCIMLPLPEPVAVVKNWNWRGVYAIITSDWMEILENGTIGFPRVSGAAYPKDNPDSVTYFIKKAQ